MATSLPSPSLSPSLPSTKTPKTTPKKLPTPSEMIAHYESKGLTTQQASLRVIEDLQKALFRKLVVENTTRKAVNAGDTTAAGVSSGRKLDVINSRLMNLDMKVDTKPGYPQALAIGVASGVMVNGIGAVVPHLASSFANLWNAVRNFSSGGVQIKEVNFDSPFV
ncbi:uncharacterized protein LOC108209246 isoform X1 [Daucus carota subsp. sativus]|uniref:uncharacterized protein LOC108209246 isoform X1 n=1 Tax=Daucus carota subsp. sativus TaxID=79200 RepID=UPI0030831772